MARLTIGELARQAGVGVETVRYYERRGLLDRPLRPARGYREYPPETLLTLRLIRRAKGLGLSLEEIGQILALRVRPRARCRELHHLLARTQAALELELRDLKVRERALADFIEACVGEGEVEDCTILRRLEGE